MILRYLPKSSHVGLSGEWPCTLFQLGCSEQFLEKQPYSKSKTTMFLDLLEIPYTFSCFLLIKSYSTREFWGLTGDSSFLVASICGAEVVKSHLESQTAIIGLISRKLQT